MFGHFLNNQRIPANCCRYLVLLVLLYCNFNSFSVYIETIIWSLWSKLRQKQNIPKVDTKFSIFLLLTIQLIFFGRISWFFCSLLPIWLTGVLLFGDKVIKDYSLYDWNYSWSYHKNLDDLRLKIVFYQLRSFSFKQIISWLFSLSLSHRTIHWFSRIFFASYYIIILFDWYLTGNWQKKIKGATINPIQFLISPTGFS